MLLVLASLVALGALPLQAQDSGSFFTLVNAYAYPACIEARRLWRKSAS